MEYKYYVSQRMNVYAAVCFVVQAAACLQVYHITSMLCYVGFVLYHALSAPLGIATCVGTATCAGTAATLYCSYAMHCVYFILCYALYAMHCGYYHRVGTAIALYYMLYMPFILYAMHYRYCHMHG